MSFSPFVLQMNAVFIELKSHLDENVEFASAEDYVSQFCVSLELASSIISDAIAIAKNAVDQNVIAG